MSNIDSENVKNAAENKKEAKPAKTKAEILDEILDILRSAAQTAIFLILFCTFIARIAIVFGDSMNETLHEGDRLLLWSLFYTPKQGDIVSANCRGLNRPDGEVIIKRIIAVGGQEVDIDFSTGTVYVDGEPLDEPYINNLTINDEGGFVYPVKVKEGYYFCMGDNRQRSTDSRDAAVGLVSHEDILGKAILRIYPFSDITFF